MSASKKYCGLTTNAFEAAEKDDLGAESQKELEALFTRENKSPNKETTSIPAPFLLVTVTVNSG